MALRQMSSTSLQTPRILRACALAMGVDGIGREREEEEVLPWATSMLLDMLNAEMRKRGQLGDMTAVDSHSRRRFTVVVKRTSRCIYHQLEFRPASMEAYMRAHFRPVRVLHLESMVQWDGLLGSHSVQVANGMATSLVIVRATTEALAALASDLR